MIAEGTGACGEEGKTISQKVLNFALSDRLAGRPTLGASLSGSVDMPSSLLDPGSE